MNLSEMSDNERRQLLRRALGMEGMPETGGNPEISVGETRYVECHYCHALYDRDECCPHCWDSFIPNLDDL